MEFSQAAPKSFHVVDYVVFVLTIAVSLGIGVYFACAGGKQKTTGEYLMGDRNLKVVPVAISMLVSFISAQGILGAPTEMYAYGTQFSMHIIAAILGSLYGAYLFVPVFYPLKLTSSFEYLERRFLSKIPRMTGSIIMILNSLFATGIGLFAPSVALEAVSGFAVWLSMVLCIVSATIYTCLGGMKAVIWTDVFQSVIIFVGLLVVVILGLIEVGGFSEMWRLNQEWGRIEFLNLDPDPRARTTFWSIVVMMSILWMCLTVAQPAVQRYCALPTERQAKISVLLNIPGFVVVGLLTCMSGVIIFAYYAKKGCDPLTARYIHNPNQILPYFVLDVMGYPGIPGLFVACLYSGSLSTASSILNSMAAITWEDFLKLKFHYLSDSKQALVTKILVVIYGALSLGVGFAVQHFGGSFVQIAFTIAGSTLGPVVGLYFLAAMFPRAGTKGAMIGVVFGLTISIWMAAGAVTSGIQSLPLPMPKENCFPNLTGVGANISSSFGVSLGNLSRPAYFVINETELASDSIGPAPPKSPEMMEYMAKMQRWSRKEFHGLENLYAVSYLWYPTVGIICVMLCGLLFSFIPGFQHHKRVSRKYLFPCIRPISKYIQPPGAASESEDSGDDEVKQPMNGKKGSSIYKPSKKDEKNNNQKQKLLVENISSI